MFIIFSKFNPDICLTGIIMSNLTRKQTERMEKKHRKLIALSELMELNEKNGRKCTTDISIVDAAKQDVDKSVEPDAKRLKTETKLDRSITDDQQQQEEQLLGTNEELINKYNETKKEVNYYISRTRHPPKIRLKFFGENALLSIPDEKRTPIFLTDLQHLIMSSLLGPSSPVMPWRWCNIEKLSKISHTVVLLVEGLSLDYFTTYATSFTNAQQLFPQYQLEVIMPPLENGNIINEIATVPMTNNNKTELISKYGSLETAIESTKDSMLFVKSIFPIDDDTEDIIFALGNNSDVFPRTQLLLSALQMVNEGYPLPLRGELLNRYKDFVFTKTKYTPVTRFSPLFGLDCEMCRTANGTNELTRISIVDENCDSIYESLVRPEHKIIDYLTQWSGITEDIMKNVTKTLKEVQKDVQKLLPSDAILVGQSLHTDLMCMQMMHPYVIDTSIIFNITGDRQRKSKLQKLALEFLNEEIQTNPLGHDSIEDCATSIKLTKLKLSKGIDFGDLILLNKHKNMQLKSDIMNGSQITNETNNVYNSNNNLKTGTNNYVYGNSSKRDQSTLVIASTETNFSYKSILSACTNDNNAGDDLNQKKKFKFIEFCNNKHAIKETIEHSMEHALTITHVKVQPNHLKRSKIEKRLRKVDQWIKEVHQSIAQNGLFILILGGHIDSTSGVVLLDIKKYISGT